MGKNFTNVFEFSASIEVLRSSDSHLLTHFIMFPFSQVDHVIIIVNLRQIACFLFQKTVLILDNSIQDCLQMFSILSLPPDAILQRVQFLLLLIKSILLLLDLDVQVIVKLELEFPQFLVF